MISRGIDRALGETQRHELDAHCGTCTGCRRFRELALAGFSMHRSMKEADPPAALLPTILEAVEACPRRSWMHGWLRLAVPAAAAAAAVLGVWIGGLMHESYGPGGVGNQTDVLELSYLDEYPPDSFGYILTATNDGGGNGQR